jgi:hypothetical protein
VIIKLENAVLRIAQVRWLTQGRNAAILQSIGKAFDTVLDAIVEGVKARFPGIGPNDSLDDHARERGLVQGPDEPDDVFIQRLGTWLDERKLKGNPYALMRQLQAYFYGHEFRFRVVNSRAAWYTLNADGTEEYYCPDPYTQPRTWVWDLGNDVWWRYWVIIYPPEGFWETDGDWGDEGSYGDAGSFGFSATQDQITAIRKIVAAWTPPHAECEHVIVSFDPSLFDPEGAETNPDGTWGYWGNKGTSRAPARLRTNVRYIAGVKS